MIKIPFDFKNIDIKNPQLQRTLAIALASIIAVALYLYFVFIPQLVRVVSLFGKTGRLRAELTLAKTTSAQTEELKKKLSEYNEKVDWYEKKLPVEREIPNLLENLSNMAKESNIKITSIMPQMAQAESGLQQGKLYQELPIRITAKSGYHELGRFLADLEKSDRFMKVTDIEIKSNRASPKQHDIDLTLCTYILLPGNK